MKALLFASLLALIFASTAFADPMIVVTPPASSSGVCGPRDPDCSFRLGRILPGTHYAPLQMMGGVRIGGNGANGAAAFRATAVNARIRSVGEGNALTVDAIYVPDAGGFRIRFTALDLDVAYFCKHPDGSTGIPFSGLFSECEPTPVLGLSGTVGRVLHDADTGRTGVRWGEINLVLNLLANAGTLEGMKTRVQAIVGGTVDTFTGGGSNGTVGRLNLALSAVLVSQDNHWELRGLAGFRPQATDWDNYTAEARLQLMYHLMLSNNFMASLGVDTMASRNTHPNQSGLNFNPFDSDRERDGMYVGALFSIPF
jgi:hypothetical protein